MMYMYNVLHWLPLQQRIMFRINAMVWWCILGLAPAYLRDLCCPKPRHQRSQFTPLIGTGVTLCSFCSYLHNPDPCILGCWPLWFLWRNDYSPGFFMTDFTLASKLFFIAVQGSGALLSSNLEAALYKYL